MANEIFRDDLYLALVAESTWGTAPGSGYIYTPVIDYTVRPVHQFRAVQPLLGMRQQIHHRKSKMNLAGQLQCPLFGYRPAGESISLAQYLVDWAFSTPETATPGSKTALLAEAGVADRQQTGLRVNSATLAGDESGAITLALDLIGKTETDYTGTGVAATIAVPDDKEKLLDFEFEDATFQLGGSSIQLHSFSLQEQHGLQMAFLNNRTPAHLTQGQVVANLNFTISKNAKTWDNKARSFVLADQYSTAQIVLKGLHNGTGSTGNYTVLTIDLGLIKLLTPADQLAFGAVTRQGLDFVVLKPDTEDNAIELTWSEAA